MAAPEPGISLSSLGSEPSTRPGHNDNGVISPSNDDLLSTDLGISEGRSLPPADRGKDAWLFLLGCFLVEAMVWGFCFSFGVFQEYYTSRGLFDDVSKVPVIGTTSSGVMYLAAPLTFLGLLAFPSIIRLSTILGVFVMCIALIASSFAENVSELIAFQGVLYAIGGSLLYAPTIIYLDQWFVQRKGLAFGIMWSGTSIAGVTLPLLFTWSLGSYGFRTTLRAWAVALALMTAPTLYFIKPRLPAARTRRFDFTFLANPAFILLGSGNIIEGLGYFIPSIFLPTYARSLGAGELPSSLTLVLLNLAQVGGCVAMGYLVDRFSVTTCISVSTIGSAIGVFFLWGFAHSLAPLYIFCVMYGLFAGSFSATWSGVMRLVSNKVARVEPTLLFAFLAAGRGIGNVFSGPLSDKLLQSDLGQGNAAGGYTSHYGALILFTGVTALFGGISVFGRAKNGLVN